MGRLRVLSESFKGITFNNRPIPVESAVVAATSEPNPESNPQSKPVPADIAAPSRNMPIVGRERSATTNSTLHTTVSSQQQNLRPGSRAASAIYTPPSMAAGTDTQIEELVPVFSFLSSHANKLYQEGYFLKLNDLDTSGKPNTDRSWTECFAQLVGTVLSLWDAAALDAAGQDGEVAPTFINLADASIKMIETLPTRTQDVQPLQNVLSISTAGKNRYLFHFNSLHSLTQWTASIRLAMFENASLQELYTGSLIAGKAKHINSIHQIMERNRFRHEDWARVRFGAGTPWRRCWCVVEPPDEKEWQKASKGLKKRSAYERPRYPKGDIKFYDSKKTKKATPIATITDAYSAYAIYPQAKSLIDQSTLVKVEGRITIHSVPESKTEGFVFVMPEVHPAVSGFEIMLRWLLPVYDCFHLYGRPNRLIADVLDSRGLMFAMPRERRYGYLEIIDVAALIHTAGSEKWSEREWRKHLKEMTSRRIANSGQARPNNATAADPTPSNPGSRNGVRYEDSGSIPSSPSSRLGFQQNLSSDAVFSPANNAGTGPPAAFNATGHHNRSVSESLTLSSPSKAGTQNQAGLDRLPRNPGQLRDADPIDSANSSDSDLALHHSRMHAQELGRDMRQSTPPGPVAPPPTFNHQANDRPQREPAQRPEIRRNKSRLSTATLEQLQEATRASTNSAAGVAAAAAWKTGGNNPYAQAPRGVNPTPSERGITANDDLYKGMVTRIPPADVELTPETSPLAELQPQEDMQRVFLNQQSIKRKPLPRTVSLPQMASSQSAPGVPLVRSPNQAHGRELTSSPDYASSRDSQDSVRMESLPKARRGILKTVGDARPASPKHDIPEIDFGITPRLSPLGPRPGTALGLTGRRSPLDGADTASPSDRRAHTPSPRASNPLWRSSITGSPAHTRGNSINWQPPQHLGRESPGPGLSAEEFVQQRYAMASRPTGYKPHRTVSSGSVEHAVNRTRKLHKKRDSYSSTHSVLSTDYSSNLSAREQEHVARMTGGPLLNLNDGRKTPDPSVGLIGAISAREQEKRGIKEGISGHTVQAAIAQRQYQAQAQTHQFIPPIHNLR
ncbi:hypothetical protein DV735_g1765, partial [Chaetothyriales sp. CBS 134920]